MTGEFDFAPIARGAIHKAMLAARFLGVLWQSRVARKMATLSKPSLL
jgi:hypothetical protein